MATSRVILKPMQSPHNHQDEQPEQDYGAELSRFRPYLMMLARLQFDEVLKSKLDESDLVQQTMLEAHQSLKTFRGDTDPEKAAWLRQILARNIADEIRKFSRGKRDIRLEQSVQVALMRLDSAHGALADL